MTHSKNSEEAQHATAELPVEQTHFGRIAAVYILGLLLGGIYVGIVSPLRTVIQADMGIDSTLGIWVINIYTLFYAATIPTSGSLADRYGRRPVFLACLILFMIGSLCCGLAQPTQNFALLMVGRVVQAAGAGGIIPAATAEMGISAPPGQRGMWLGIAAAVSGLANVFGASVGSIIASVTGTASWGWAFYIAVPFGLVLLIAGWAWLPRREHQVTGRLDIIGSLLFTALVICLLLGIKNISPTNLLVSLASINVWGPLALGVLLCVVFVYVEKRQEVPVLHLEFFGNRCLRLIMLASFFVGCSIISMQLIPEFAEYLLNAPVGSGGYYITIIGVFAIAGPPLSGKLIDRFGAKPVLLFGLGTSTVGFLFLAIVTTAVPSVITLLIGLAIMGLGMGFSMGTPLNYLTLQNVSEDHSTSAIGTITLIRQMGTTLFPALLVSFTTVGLGMAGYSYLLITVAVVNLLAALIMVVYPEKRA